MENLDMSLTSGERELLRERSYEIYKSPKNVSMEDLWFQFEPMAKKVASRWPESPTMSHEDLVSELLTHLLDKWHLYDPSIAMPSTWVWRVFMSRATRVMDLDKWKGTRSERDDRQLHSLEAIPSAHEFVAAPEETWAASADLSSEEVFVTKMLEGGYTWDEICRIMKREPQKDYIQGILESAAEKLGHEKPVRKVVRARNTLLPEETEDMRKRYLAGESTVDLAERYSMATGTVRLILKEAGVTLRKRGARSTSE